MTSTSLLQLSDINAGYDPSAPVIQHCSVEFPESTTTVVVGPSGAGKSTLLYVCGLMLRPLSGDVILAGSPFSRASDRLRAQARAEHIAMVFQDALIEPSMTVMENVLEGVPFNRSRRAYRLRADELLDRVGIAHLRQRQATKLSGGQAQRVALARALLKRPTVVLADEPTGNLDDATASIILSELHSYAHEPGRCCVLVTHDNRIAASADHLLNLGP